MNYSINYSKILTSAVMIAFVIALVFGGTQAFFSDEETSEGNLFTAGALDLKVDSVAHFNGLICEEVSPDVFEWHADGVTFAEDADVPPEHYPQPGNPCEGTWEETDLGIEHRFFNFDDLKPGDIGENTISLHVYDNDAWGCFYVENVEDNDNGLTEPEEEGGDTTGGDGEGELGAALSFDSWLDDGTIPGFQCNHDGATPTVGASCDEDPEEGDNILNGGEQLFWEGETVDEASEGPFNQSDVLAAAYSAHGCTEATGKTDYGNCHGLAEDGRMVGSATYYWGLAWSIPVETGNEIQTDSLVSDMVFTATQHRNNPNFSCPVLDVVDNREPVGAVLAAYTAPTCDATVADDESIQTAVDAAAADATVCVADSYTGVGDDVAIRIETTGVTLAALTQGTAVDVPVVLSADGVTVTGLTGSIGQAESPSEVAAFYLDDDATNATLSYNTVSGSGSGAAVLTESGADNSGSLITNNSLAGAVQGIYLNPHTGLITIEYNDIDDNVAGIGNLNGALVQYNEFEHSLASQEAIGAGTGSFGDYDGSTIQFNNFLDGTMINAYPDPTITVVAPNNFFGPDGAAVQAPTNVDYAPEEGTAFPHN